MHNPWDDLPSSADFVHPDDRRVIEAFATRPAGASDATTALQLHRLPEPFAGPLRPRVLLLLLNPGSKGTEPRVAAGDPVIDRFRRAMAAHNVPHIHFGADVGDTPGSQWWRRRAIGGLLASTKLSEDQLAARLGVVQFVPYASRKWGHGHLRLPTQAYAFWRVEQAVEAGAYMIVRGLDVWAGAVPMLLDPAVRDRVFEFRNSRNTAISERNLKPGQPVDGPSPFERIRATLSTR